MKKIYFIMFFVFILLTSNASATTGEFTPDGKVLSPGVIMLLLGDEAKYEDEPGEVNEWKEMESMEEARAFHAVVAHSDGYLYVIGGLSLDPQENLNPTNNIIRYDTANDEWDKEFKPTLDDPLFEIDAEIIDGKIYIPGDSSTAVTYVFDIEEQKWLESIEPNNDPDNIYIERAYYRTVAIGTDLYVLGGYFNDSNTTTDEVWILNTETAKWSEGAPMQHDRMSFAAGVIDGVIYVAGGYSLSIPNYILSAEKFNPYDDSDEWLSISGISDGGGKYASWAYMADGVNEDALWLAGGTRAGLGDDLLYHSGFYDPETDKWTDSTTDDFPTLNQGRVHLSGALASDGYFYAIGGHDDAQEPTIYNNNERLRVK